MEGNWSRGAGRDRPADVDRKRLAQLSRRTPNVLWSLMLLGRQRHRNAADAACRRRRRHSERRPQLPFRDQQTKTQEEERYADRKRLA